MIRVFKVLPHLLIVLAAVFIAMEVLDWYNPYMNFLGLRASAALMTAFCCLSFVQSARAILCERRLSGAAVKKAGPVRRTAPGRAVNRPALKYLPQSNTRGAV